MKPASTTTSRKFNKEGRVFTTNTEKSFGKIRKNVSGVAN